MKHDDCDEIYTLARERLQTPWWRWIRALRLNRKINRKWSQFIQEICGEHSESSLPRWMREENSSVPADPPGNRSDMQAPAVILINPKYPHNVGNAFRACAALGAAHLYVTGSRAQWEATGKGQRLPREERMKQYNGKVELVRTERPFDYLDTGVVPVAVEISPTAEPLALFQHPDNACYIFGPEDGGIPKAIRALCHRFVILPTDHCINLAAAVNCVLMDRRVKRQLAGLEPILAAYDTIREDRG